MTVLEHGSNWQPHNSPKVTTMSEKEGTQETKGENDESKSEVYISKEEFLKLSRTSEREVMSKKAYMKKKRTFFFPLLHFDIEVGPSKTEDQFEMMIDVGLHKFVDLKKVAKKEIELDNDTITDALFDRPELLPKVLGRMEMWGACNITRNPKIHPTPHEGEERDEEKWYWDDLDAEDQERLKDLANGNVKDAEWILTGRFRPPTPDVNPTGDKGGEVRDIAESDMGT